MITEYRQISYPQITQITQNEKSHKKAQTVQKKKGPLSISNRYFLL
jgi:hypothetical protein